MRNALLADKTPARPYRPDEIRVSGPPETLKPPESTTEGVRTLEGLESWHHALPSRPWASPFVCKGLVLGQVGGVRRSRNQVSPLPVWYILQRAIDFCPMQRSQ